MASITQGSSQIQIKEFIQKLTECRTKLEQKQQETPVVLEKTVKEQLQDVLDEKWNDIETEKNRAFEEEIEIAAKAFLIELSIIESARGAIDDTILAEMEEVYVKVRKTNDLKSMMKVFTKNRKDLKIRNTLILLNAVYRYNRDLASNIDPNPGIASKIKYASACHECGDVANDVRINLIKNKFLQLP